MSKTASAIAQEQLDAYNAHDLTRFLAVYAEDVKVYRLPALEPAISGKAALAEFYASRFTHPQLQAELVNRIAFGNKVIDHERVHGLPNSPFEVAASYQVDDGLITTVWFLAQN